MSAAARPRRRRRPAGLLLAPGAGSSRDHPTLLALEAGLDLPVERFDFPYRRAGRRSPDRAPVLIAAVRDAAAAFAERLGVEPAELVLGGRSMGGRMCSMGVAEGLPAAGLVLLSYPLHPLGRPEKLRVDHFPQLDVPCLFLAGDRDPFGSPDEVEHHTSTIPGVVTTAWLEHARHDPRGHDEAIVSIVRAWVTGL